MAVRIPISTEGGQKAVDDLKKVGDAGQQALDRINRASKEPAAGLKALNGVTSEARSGLEDLSGRAGVVGRALSALGPIGIAAGAAIGVFTLGISQAVAEADKAERARLKIEALLRTTQGASGHTYGSIASLADEIALSTMATGDAVEAAAAQLLTFKAVSGDAFARTLKVAQDMAAVMGGDMSAAIMQLGKALEDPERGLNALRRSGISFTEQQGDMIKALAESGDQARAMAEILKILESQIGGAGAADSGTLSGAFHHLTERVGMFFENIGKNSGLLTWFTGVVETAAKGMGNIDGAIFKDLDTQAAEKFNELAEARARLDKLMTSTNSAGQRPDFSIEQQRERVAAIEAELKALTDKIQTEAEAAQSAKQAAQQARIAATEEAIAANLREKSEERMDELQKDRDARLKKEAAEQQRISKARSDARTSIDGQIDSLENEQKALALAERERAIFVELLKAEETARKAGITVTNEQREAIIRETGALFDQKKAIDDKKKAEEEATREAEKQARERERIAEREAEALQAPFLHAAEGIQDALTDSIESGLHGTLDSAADVFEHIKNIAIRAAAEVASAWIIRPAIAGTGLFGTGSASASSTATAGAQLAGGGTGVNPISAISSFLGPAGSLLGIGGAAGLGISQITGGDPLGSSVGGAAGAYAGMLAGSGILGGATGALVATLGQLGNFVIPGLGLIIGALAGGSLFGNKEPSNESAFGKIDLSTGARLPTAAERNSNAQTREARDQLVEAIELLRTGIIEATGGTISGRVGLDVGQRDGIQVFGVASGTFKDPEAALAAIFEGMLDNLQGVDKQFEKVFDNLDTSDLEKAVADLGAAAAIINKDYVAAKPLNDAAAAIKSIKDNFKPIIDTARELGLAVKPIADERNRQINQLRKDFNLSIDDQLLAIADPLQAALNAFDKIAEDRIDNAEALGIKGRQLNDVIALNEAERLRIIENYNRAALDSLNGLITDLNRTGLTPEATLGSLAAEFSNIFEAANTPGANLNDLAAQATALAPQIISVGQQAYASGPQFQELKEVITSLLTQLRSNISATSTGGGGNTIQIVTTDGRILFEDFLENMLARSARGETVVYARGVA